MKLFHNIEELNEKDSSNTIHIARLHGFDTIQREDDGKVLCGKHGSSELIEVYQDGSWELTDEEVSGTGSVDLKILFKLGVKEYRLEMNGQTI
jgi:hypothetical protein